MHSVIIAILALGVTLAACASNSRTAFDGGKFFQTFDRQAGGSAE